MPRPACRHGHFISHRERNFWRLVRFLLSSKGARSSGRMGIDGRSLSNFTAARQSAYPTPCWTRVHADGGQCSSVMTVSCGRG
jgi:hypothetical protein